MIEEIQKMVINKTRLWDTTQQILNSVGNTNGPAYYQLYDFLSKIQKTDEDNITRLLVLQIEYESLINRRDIKEIFNIACRKQHGYSIGSIARIFDIRLLDLIHLSKDDRYAVVYDEVEGVPLALDLSSFVITNIHDDVKTLIHLKYLIISKENISEDQLEYLKENLPKTCKLVVKGDSGQDEKTADVLETDRIS